MHQTFYIDADEEISSVIDRVNKSVSKDNYFVVPKRAIFLQSIVNLKLLKREADKLGKRLIIVTQDEIGASMAHRSGLEVKSNLDGLDAGDKVAIAKKTVAKKMPSMDEYDEIVDDSHGKRHRLSGVGSDDFYDSKGGAGGGKVAAKKIAINSVSSARGKQTMGMSRVHAGSVAGTRGEVHKNQRVGAGPLGGKKIDPDKEKTLEKMFSASTTETAQKKSKKHGSEINGLAKKIFVWFVVLCVFIFAGTAVYLFLPSAKVTLVPNVLNEKVDIVVHGGTDVPSAEGDALPVRVIDKEESLTLSYDVSGTTASAGKKAHGKVVLYNEFDSSPQTLVATTRLESTDGKIFRLTKTVVVPGVVSVGGQTKPGAIEAEVIADQAGSDFNISPTSFSIPGFKDGPKYEKFYAKSTENFVGGTTEGGNVGGAVSQKDIDSAKQKTEAALSQKAKQDIDAQLGEGEIALEQAERVTFGKGSTSVKIGDTVDKFEYTSTATVRAVVFAERDIKTLISQSVKGKQNLVNTNWDVSKIEYGISVADFDKNTLELRVHGEISITPIIDMEKVKKELLGKKDDQLGAILRNYPSIKSVNVEFQPTIISRIPQYAGRVSVELENSSR